MRPENRMSHRLDAVGTTGGKVSIESTQRGYARFKPLQEENARLKKQLADARETIDALRKENNEWKASFELYHRALMKGTNLWKRFMKKKDVWPDTAKMLQWLMKKIDTATDLCVSIEVMQVQSNPHQIESMQAAQRKLAKQFLEGMK